MDGAIGQTVPGSRVKTQSDENSTFVLKMVFLGASRRNRSSAFHVRVLVRVVFSFAHSRYLFLW